MALKVLIRKIILSDQLELSGSSVFLRNDQQIIGTGRAIQIAARGKNRVAELAAGWKEILATAEIREPIRNQQRRADCADLNHVFRKQLSGQRALRPNDYKGLPGRSGL